MKKVYIPSRFLKTVVSVLNKHTVIIEESNIDYHTFIGFVEAKSKEEDGLVFTVDGCFGLQWDFPTDEDIDSIDDNFTLFDFVDYAKELFPVENNKSDFESFLEELYGFIGGYLEKIK